MLLFTPRWNLIQRIRCGISVIWIHPLPRETGERWTAELIRRIRLRPERRVILSEEMCWFTMDQREKRPLFQDFIEQLKTLADVTLIVYLRRQDLFLMSSYQEHLKSGWLNGRTCRQELNAQDQHYLHYRDNIEWLIPVLGSERILVRPFESSQFFGNSLLEDFLQCVGVPLTDEFVGTDIVNNTGMSDFLTEIMRCLSFYRYTRDELAVFWGADCLQDERCFNRGREHEYLSPHERRNYLSRFKEGNRWIASELLGRTDGVLFKEDLPLEGEPWTEYKLDKDEVRSFFNRAYFLSRAQRRKMCRQVLSVCEGVRPISLHVRDILERVAMQKKSVRGERFLSWLHGSKLVLPEVWSETPLFSIIMPVFNRQATVADSLKSIQLQDLSSFEVIVIDDASTDHTADVVTRIAHHDPRIKLIRLEKNIGPGPARNIGIDQARGDYIRICDSDDFYPPGALSAFAHQIFSGEDDLIAGNFVNWHGRMQEIRPSLGPW